MAGSELVPYHGAGQPSLLAPAEWPLPEDRANVAQLPAETIAERIADQLPTDHDREVVAGVTGELLAGGAHDPGISYQDALRLAFAAHLADRTDWQVVPKTTHGLPGVDQELADQTLALEPDAHAENVATMAQGTNSGLAHTDATNVTLALQNTEWGGVSPAEKANFLAWVGPILGQMSVGMHALPPEGGQ